MRNVLLVAMTAGLMALLMVPAPAVGQEDCGDDCRGCGPFPQDYHEGYNESAWGDNDMACPPMTNTDCNECFVAPAEGALSQDDIGRALLLATALEMPTVVAAYGDRLLLSDKQDLVAVRGNACTQDALGVWVTVSPEKMTALRAAGVQSLDDLLRQRAEQP